MREGLLAEQTEFGSKPLRDHLKRAYTYKRTRVIFILLFAFSGGAEGRPSFSPGSGERHKGAETSNDTWRL